MLYIPIVKRCCTCRLFASTSEFTRNKSTGDGYCRQCTKCKRDSEKASYKLNKSYRRTHNREYRQKYPDKIKEWKRRNYIKHRDIYAQSARNYYQANSAQYKARAKEWRINNPKKAYGYTRTSVSRNPTKYKNLRRTWKENNPEKIRVYRQRRLTLKRLLPVNFTPSDWQQALMYFDGRCAVCGAAPGPQIVIAMDHWIPLSDSRPDNPGTVVANIVPLCHGSNGCNNSKGSRDPFAWLVSKFGKQRAEDITQRITAYFQNVSVHHASSCSRIEYMRLSRSRSMT